MGQLNPVGPKVVQIGLVVPDIAASAAAYAKLLGVDVPPINQAGPQCETHVEYRGRPTQAGVKQAVFHLEGISLELLEPVGSPSVWADHLAAGCEGVHHIAIRVPDMDAALARLAATGMELIQKGDFVRGRYAYVDSQAKLGVMLELISGR